MFIVDFWFLLDVVACLDNNVSEVILQTSIKSKEPVHAAAKPDLLRLKFEDKSWSGSLDNHQYIVPKMQLSGYL